METEKPPEKKPKYINPTVKKGRREIPPKRFNGKNRGRGRIHTCPELAGEKNMPENAKGTDKNGFMQVVYPIYKHGREESYRYKEPNYDGLWTEEELYQSIDDYFVYCNKNVVKPTAKLAQLWLGMSNATWYEWLNNPHKYGYKSDAIKLIREVTESYLTLNVDTYPTGSIFLLKAYHGIKDSQTVEVKASGTSADEVAESLKRLGLVDGEAKDGK